MKEVETHHKTGCYLLWFDLMMIKEKRREDEWKERERGGRRKVMGRSGLNMDKHILEFSFS